jgi:hypothetical protein
MLGLGIQGVRLIFLSVVHRSFASFLPPHFPQPIERSSEENREGEKEGERRHGWRIRGKRERVDAFDNTPNNIFFIFDLL